MGRMIRGELKWKSWTERLKEDTNCDHKQSIRLSFVHLFCTFQVLSASGDPVSTS